MSERDRSKFLILPLLLVSDKIKEEIEAKIGYKNTNQAEEINGKKIKIKNN